MVAIRLGTGPSSRTGWNQPHSARGGRIATIFRWTLRSPQDLAPVRSFRPMGCPGFKGPVPLPVLMDGTQLARAFPECQSLDPHKAMDVATHGPASTDHISGVITHTWTHAETDPDTRRTGSRNRPARGLQRHPAAA